MAERQHDTGNARTPPWSLGVVAAVGVGLGAALAASMGSVGYAIGLLATFVPYAVARRRSRR